MFVTGKRCFPRAPCPGRGVG